MALPIKILDGDGNGNEAHVHRRGIHAGVVAFTDDLFEKLTTVTPLLNDSFGADMNQNVAFGAIPSIIHDGGTSSNRGTGNADDNVENELKDSGGTPFDDVVVGMSVENTDAGTYANVVTVHSNNRLTLTADIFPLGTEAYAVDAVWTGTAVQGTWNFADSAKITLTAGENGDEASIDANALASYDMSNFTAFTGKIDLDLYNGTNHNFTIQFDLNGVPAGVSVNLNDYIDTGNFAEQAFVIPKADLGLSSQSVNGLTIQLVRSGGAKPTMKFDDLQFEATGTPAPFIYTPQSGQTTKLISLKVIMADDVTTIAAASGYNKLLSVSALTNGITVTAISKGETVFSGSFIQLADFLIIPNSTFEVQTDGTNSWLTINFPFNDHPVILEGQKGDSVSFTINDDLSSLLLFRAFVSVTENI